MKRGVIAAIGGQGMASLLRLVFEDGSQTLVENPSGVRALVSVFALPVLPGHGVDLVPLVGEEIVYQEDGLGIMTGFCPAAEYDEDCMEAQYDEVAE